MTTPEKELCLGKRSDGIFCSKDKYGGIHALNCPERNQKDPTHTPPSMEWENDFYEVLPIVCSSLTNDSKTAAIKKVFEKILKIALQEKDAEIARAREKIKELSALKNKKKGI